MATKVGRFSSKAALRELPNIPPVVLAQQLGLDDQVIADIGQDCGHEEESYKLAVLRYWENNDPSASWQTLAEAVMRLRLYRATGERIMSIHVSKSFTVERVLTALEGIDDLFELGYPLLKTSSSLRTIARDLPNDDERKQRVVECWMKEDEHAGWERLAATISDYMPNHNEIAEKIRKEFITEPLEKAVPENPPSPALENPVSTEQALDLCSTVSDWYALGWLLMLPDHVEQELEEIECEHEDSRDRLGAVLNLWSKKRRKYCTWQWLASTLSKMPQDSHLADRIHHRLAKGKLKYVVPVESIEAVAEGENPKPEVIQGEVLSHPWVGHPESGMELVGEKHLCISGNNQHHLNWEECGLRIHFPEGSLPRNSTARLSIYAVHSGPFLYPDNSAPVSCIYYFKLSRPLLKPAVLEVEHCSKVNQQDPPYLSFALASMSTQPPYVFELIDDGIFQPGSRYAILRRQSFSSLTVLEHVGRLISKWIGWPSLKRRRSSADDDTTINDMRSNRNYIMRGYYGYKTQTQEWQVFIFILRDLAYNEKLARKKVVQELSHELFETEELQAIDLHNSKPYIHLGIQSETEMNSKLSALNGQEIHNGWRILPGGVPCQIERSTIDQMDKRTASLPHVKLRVDYTGSLPKGSIIKTILSVKLLNTGITPEPGIFLKLSHPVQWRRRSSRLSSTMEDYELDPDNEPSQKDLEKFVVRKCDSKWKSMATLLDLDENTISSIDADYKQNKDKLRAVLEVWKKVGDEQRKWSDIFAVLKEVNEGALVSSLCATALEEP